MPRFMTGAAFVVVSAACVAGSALLRAQDYPRVYGPTGRLYGPTQAEYQYERQYGHEWQGSGGSYQSGGGYHHGGGHHFHSGSAFIGPNIGPYGYGYSGFYGGFGGGFGYGFYGGFGGYGPYGYGYDPYGGYGYPFGPTATFYQPGGVQPFMANPAPLQEWLDEGEQQWNAPLDDLPVEELPRRYVKPSSTDAQLRAIRLQHEGDLQLRNLQFTTAVRRYTDAIATAPDVTDPYFHLAIAETGRGNFREAILQLKYGLQLNPTWPASGETLDDLLGEGNLLAKTQIKQRVLDWVQEDIRDPDRLFLMGALLYMDNDTERGAVLLETAARLGGMKDYLSAFLDPQAPQAAAPPADNAAGPAPGDVVVPPPPPAPDGAAPATQTPRAAEPVLPPPPVLN